MPTRSPSLHSSKRQTLLHERPALMRACGTESERRLWRCLVNRKLGVPFRRQYVLGERIVDFVALSARLIVEVDGASHAGREHPDARRRLGYRVLHVEAREVMGDLVGVVARILRGARGWVKPCDARS
jgi:leucyl-tRNA synthetase